MATDATPELLAEIETKKNDMATAREGMKEGIKYSSRSLGGHTTQYRKLCRRAGIPVEITKVVPAEETPAPTIGKPCRYKACKGRNHKLHGEKCPVASARGKTGGLNGDGEAKQRLGSTNGNFRAVRPCGCPMRAHKPDCEHARPANRKDFGTTAKKVRQVLNIQSISWQSKALSVGAVAHMMRGVTGVCSGCKESIPAVQAVKVHPDDIMQNPARVICGGCE